MNNENTIAKSAPKRNVAITKKQAAGQEAAQRNVTAKAVKAKSEHAAVIAEGIADLATGAAKRAVKTQAKAAGAVREDYAVYMDAQRHTCIRVGLDRSGVQFIAMAGILEVAELPHYEFETRYTQQMDYPVKQAARMYLEASHLERTPIAQKHLDYLCGNTFVDPVAVTQFNHKESIMTPAAEKAAAAKKAAPAVTKAPAKKAEPAKAAARPAAKPEAAKPVDKKATAAAKFAGAAPKAAPAKASPTKVAAPAAGKTAPAKAEKAAPAKPVVAQKVKVEAAPKAPGKVGAPRAPDNTAYVLADPAKERKGATAEACTIAKKLGATFTRAKLHEALLKAGWEEKVAKVKIADCVYFKVFAEAPKK